MIEELSNICYLWKNFLEIISSLQKSSINKKLVECIRNSRNHPELLDQTELREFVSVKMQFSLTHETSSHIYGVFSSMFKPLRNQVPR